jgi:hypothetical protein
MPKPEPQSIEAKEQSMSEANQISRRQFGASTLSTGSVGGIAHLFQSRQPDAENERR